jgi:competence protein ComEC
VEVRAALWVVTAGVVGGQLIAAYAGQPAAGVALGMALALLAAGTPPGSAGRAALAAGALGVVQVDRVARPRFPGDHVARLALPLRTTLMGRIASAPAAGPGRTVVVVEAEAVGRGEARRPVRGLVRLAVRGPHHRLRHGDRIAVETTLRAPRNFENPGRFDWVGHLARRGIHVTASVWDGRAVRRLPGRAHGPRARLERWRARLGRAMATAAPPAEGAVLRALVVGDEHGIDPALREAFTRAGVVHVLSISGLHVGLVAAAGFVLARRLLVRSEGLALRADVDRLAAAASLGPVLFYTLLAGLGVATLRAAIMVAAAVAAGLVGRRVDVPRSLALAALLLALAWPGAPLEIGFQLSFASVAAIVCGVRRFGGGRPGWRGWVRNAVVVPPCALLGTAPLTAFHFHQVSVAGLVANPLVVPLFGSLVVGLGLVGAVLEPVTAPGAAVLFVLAARVLRPGIALVEALGRPGWAALDVPMPSAGEVALLYGLLGGLALVPRRAGAVLLAVALAGIAGDTAWWTHERCRADRLRVTFLDVGQGDAAVAELPGGAVLVVDAGGFPASDFDTGEAVVGPFLWTRKILRLDALAMTHAHPDHIGGVPYLLAHQRPAELWWTGVPGAGPTWERIVGAIAASGAHVRVLRAGAPLPAFASATEVLHPPAGAHGLTLNDSSLTLRLTHGGVRLLLTGDIEAAAEEGLTAAPGRLAATVLKVPHHGSRTSSTAAFAAAVAPRVAVVSVGAGNGYGLPDAEVEARYRALGACVLRTDRCGAVTVETDGHRVAVRTVRPGCECPGLR